MIWCVWNCWVYSLQKRVCLFWLPKLGDFSMIQPAQGAQMRGPRPRPVFWQSRMRPAQKRYANSGCPTATRTDHFLFLWFGLIWWVLVALNLQNKKNWSPLHSTVAVAAMAHRPPWSRISLVWNIFYFSILGIVTPTDFHIFQRGRSTTNQWWY